MVSVEKIVLESKLQKEENNTKSNNIYPQTTQQNSEKCNSNIKINSKLSFPFTLSHLVISYPKLIIYTVEDIFSQRKFIKLGNLRFALGNTKRCVYTKEANDVRNPRMYRSVASTPSERNKFAR